MTLSVDPKINWTMDVMPSAIQMENFPVAGLTVAGAETRGTETETIVIVVKTVWITGRRKNEKKEIIGAENIVNWRITRALLRVSKHSKENLC